MSGRDSYVLYSACYSRYPLSAAAHDAAGEPGVVVPDQGQPVRVRSRPDPDPGVGQPRRVAQAGPEAARKSRDNCVSVSQPILQPPEQHTQTPTATPSLITTTGTYSGVSIGVALVARQYWLGIDHGMRNCCCHCHCCCCCCAAVILANFTSPTSSPSPSPPILVGNRPGM